MRPRGPCRHCRNNARAGPTHRATSLVRITDTNMVTDCTPVKRLKALSTFCVVADTGFLSLIGGVLAGRRGEPLRRVQLFFLVAYFKV